MRLGILAADLAGTPGPLTEEARSALRDAAYQFARAGGRPTLAEWVSLSTEEREALADAAAALRRDESVRRDPTPPEAEALEAAVGRIAGVAP